jgi:hypothetical protein
MAGPFKMEIPENERIFSNLIRVESQGRVDAVSSRGAIGFGQITPQGLEYFNTFNASKIRYSTNDMFDHDKNMVVSRWIFRTLVKHHGNVVEAVNSYNMGASNTAKGWFYRPYLTKICSNEFVRYLSQCEILSNKGNIIYLTKH